MPDRLNTAQRPAQLVELVYELLDAHNDTARLARALAAGDPVWEIHLDYLRALQRAAREELAHLDQPDDA